jgi:peroxiredoxin
MSGPARVCRPPPTGRRDSAATAAAPPISPLTSLTVFGTLCNFARLVRVWPRSRCEGPLLSWQRPNGPAWRERYARGRRALWVSCLALACAAGQSQAQQPYPLIGQAAPDFALRATAGDNVRLSEHRGDVVVLSFWSSRCSSCRQQLDALNRSLATYRSAGLLIYGVGVDDDVQAARDFAHSVRVNFTMLLDPEKAVSRDYQVDNLPMTVLIDRNGTVRYALRDFSGASDRLYLQQLRALLNE